MLELDTAQTRLTFSITEIVFLPLYMLKARPARNGGLSLPASQKLVLLHTECFLIYITVVPHLKALSTSKSRRSDLSSANSVQS